MLVLSRKLKQEIMIGENIKITVLKIKGNTVRLGIEAPRDIHVVRGEIPKKSDVVGAQEIGEPQMADFTVVFTNTDEAGSKVDVIPFESEQSNDSDRPKSGMPKAAVKSPKPAIKNEVDSIQFRDRLPKVLQHNRLKEIVDQLTSK